MKIAIVTDSNSGIFERQARKMGVHVVPMPFSVNGEWLYEGVQLTAPDFYKAQAEGADITTSMPSPADVTELWEKLLADHDELVYIPMTSGLSGSCAAAAALAEDYDGRVQVVDNKRISLTQLQSVLDAKRLVKRGLTAAQVKAQLEQHALDASIYITCSDLKYLKKGGRITPAAAAFGTVLGIKPVLQIQGGKLDALTMSHGIRAAKRAMLDAVEHDLLTRFAGKDGVFVEAAYSCSEEEAAEWADEIRARFGERFDGYIAPLSLSIACHTGPGGFGVGCVKRLA